jgi:hypothetical protein
MPLPSSFDPLLSPLPSYPAFSVDPAPGGLFAGQIDRGIEGVGSPVGDGGGGGTQVCPFSYDSVAEQFIPGTVGGVVPTNMGDTFTFPLTGTRYCYLDCSATAQGQITAATIVVSATAPGSTTPTQGTAPVSFDFLFGVAVDGVYSLLIPCGSPNPSPFEVIRIEKPGPLFPGELPYDTYWSWA